MYFLISLDTSLTHGLFRNMLVSFKALDHIIFLLLISSLILLGSENILYMVSTLLNLSDCFMIQDEDFRGVCSMGT